MDTAGTESRDGKSYYPRPVAWGGVQPPERERVEPRDSLLREIDELHYDILHNDNFACEYHHHHRRHNEHNLIVCSADHDKHNTLGFVIDNDGSALLIDYGSADHTHD